MTRPLVIVGAGGFARETIEVVHAINAERRSWELLGLLDDDPAKHGTEVGGAEVLGPLSWLARQPAVAAVVCIGNPANFASRRAVVHRLSLPTERYATLVHPTAVVARRSEIGPGGVLHAHTVLTTDVELGAHVAIMPAVVFTHDDVVADFATFGAGVRLAGSVQVGTGAYLGSGCLVRENLSIGAWSMVGMGSVVTRPVPAGEVWLGQPARHHGPSPHAELVHNAAPTTAPGFTQSGEVPITPR